MNEVELLFTEILKCSRLSLYLNHDVKPDVEKLNLISIALKRRSSGEPIQYILGKTEFMGLDFKVTRDVFIPRPETEILVETALKCTSYIVHRTSFVNILDVGTGSGCIAVSLAKYLPDAQIDAADVSDKALAIAKENAKLNAVEINFLLADLFDTYDLRLTTYDLIISNPPYIPCAEIDKLQPEVRNEPRIALDGGRDGLDFYRRIIAEAGRYLKEDGFLIMELGISQRGAIEKIFINAGNFEIIEVVKDYNGIERVIIAQN